MKKFSAIVCAMVLVAFAAQADAAATWKWGVKGGVNVANISGDDIDDTSSRTGLAAGGFLAANYGGTLGSRIEALYIQKGAKQDVEILSETYEVTYKIDYLEFPILATANFPAGEKAMVNLFAGPTLGFVIGESVEVDGESEDTEDTESFEFGLVFGAGAEFGMFVLDLRYGLGLSNIAKDSPSDVKNQGFAILAGLQFPLGAGAP
jgi:opacity protein-like surface antigen